MAEDKHFLDKHQNELIQRVNNTAAILDELFSENVIQQHNYDKIRALPTSQEIMRELFNQPLTSSGDQGKETFYKILNKHESYLIDDLKRMEYENPMKVETVMAKKMLYETLNDLRTGELDYFKSLIELEKDYPPISRSQLKVANTQDTVELMVETYREECVELTRKVLKKMNRADLVQRLSDTSSGSKEKQRPSLIQRVETMTSVIELLLETLADLRDVELRVFQMFLHQIHSSNIQWRLLMTADMQDTVFFMVLIDGQQSVETTKKVLEKMEKTDLVQMLSDSSSGSKKKHSVDERLSALIHKVATMRAVKELLLETLSDLSNDELEKFKVLLQFTFFQRSLELISWKELSLPHTSWSERSPPYTSWSELSPPLSSSHEVSLPHTSWSERSPPYISWSKPSPPLASSHEVRLQNTSWSERSPPYISWIKPSPPLSSSHEVSLPHTSWSERSPPHTSWSKWSPPLSSSGEVSPPHTSWSEWRPPLSSLVKVSSLRKPGRDPSFLFPSLRRQINKKDRLVDMMLKKCGQQSVEVTMEVLTDMNRTDLMQRLSETSSGHKAAGSSAEAFGVSTMQEEKHCVDEHWPALIQKVETMTSVIVLLLETVVGLSDGELRILKRVLQTQTNLHLSFSDSTLIPLKIEDRQVTVFLMVLTYGQQSVEKTEEVLKEMTRTDLVQRLSHSSSQSKKKRLDEHRSALIQKVATMAVVKQLLLETLNSLSDKELEEFRQFLMWIIRQKKLKAISPISLRKDRAEIVDLMLQTYSQQSVSLTREAVKKMNRTDLMQRLSKPSSEHEEKHSVDEHQTAVLEKAAVKQILLETLKDLSSEELEKIKRLLQFTQFQKGLPRTPWEQLYKADSTKALVDLMVQTCGQQSVEVTKEVFMDMNRTDLVKKLSVISSSMKEKHPSEQLQKVVTMTSLMDKLFETLKDLSYIELEQFKHVLQYTAVKKGLPKISRQRMVTASRDEIVELMVEIYSEQSVEVTRRVLMEMDRTDLVERLSEVSSEKQRPSLIQRVETVTSVIELLLETLADLRDVELRELRVFQRFLHQIHSSNIQRRLLMTADMQDTVFFMVLIDGQQSVETTKKVLEKMEKTDLVQTLSDSSSGSKKEHSVDERLSALIHKVATMRAVKELLLETLRDLSNDELEKFKVLLQFTFFQRSLELISWKELSLLHTSWSELSPPLSSSHEVSLPHTSWSERSPPYISWSKRSLPLSSSDEARLQNISWSERSPPHTSWSKRSLPLSSSDEARLQNISWSERSPPHTSWSKWSPPLSSSGEVSPPHTSWSEWRPPLSSSVEVSSLRKPGREPSFLFASLRRQINKTDRLVDMMLKKCGQQSVEVTMEVLTDMNRTDLMQRLSETSSGHKAAGSSAEAFGVSTTQEEKHCVDEHWPALIQKVETMTSVIVLLLETVVGLSDGELRILKRVLQTQTNLHLSFSDSTLIPLKIEDRQVTVFLMVLTYGQQSVEKTEEVLKEMTRTDLVQRLSHSSSQSKKKRLDEHRSALIQKVATMAVVKQLLLETLNSLSDKELKEFKKFLMWIIRQKKLKAISPISLRKDRAKIVDLMLQTYSQQSVSLTREAVKKMNRTDLMQRLSKPSSEHEEKHSVDEHQTAVLEKAAVKQILLETLKDLSSEELEKIKRLLQFTQFQKGLPRTPWEQLYKADSTKALVDLMVQTCGQQSVEVTKEVFMDMNRTDLVKKLSVISSSMKEKHPSERLQTVVTMTSLMDKLFETLKDLSYIELKQFKHVLQHTTVKKGLPKISRQRMETASRDEIVELMVEIYSEQSVEVTRRVLMEMDRTDLVERLSEVSSGPSGSSELEGCGSVAQDSSDWTKLDPEVNCTDADEAPTYSLQSEAGNFECSVSGVRWVCKEKVSFKYQFCSLSGHMEKIESMQYMPASPLMDITDIAGKLDVVYLPHWIAIDDNPTILDKFAVLHIDDCGDVVERVSEVTSSHVKLSEPVFSLKLILVKYLGLSVEIHCKVLIYKADTPSLKLHVYLIPPDRALIQELERTLSRDGYKRIHEPHPVKPLKMHEWFTLTADLDGTKIRPEAIMLTYESTEPNFFQVLCTKNPDTNFALELKQKNELQPVWTCEIQKGQFYIIPH
ncbi:hypothetical protein ABVT39_002046 [Epinephelus coioides]